VNRGSLMSGATCVAAVQLQFDELPYMRMLDTLQTFYRDTECMTPAIRERLLAGNVTEQVEFYVFLFFEKGDLCTEIHRPSAAADTERAEFNAVERIANTGRPPGADTAVHLNSGSARHRQD
jgi:hypothetical protein